ncbi:MAG: Flp pilus assembly complex ATPase component TadA, partial [Anaerohalosphaera sp.]|nr:Flp pilus assembly complex ATPase component TadA [Anaerohalosphaera sp.]
DAVWRRASEVVFQPGPEEYSLIYRIDGHPFKQDPIPREEMEYFLHYLKQLTDLDVNERRKPQTGAFTLKKDEESFKWEINTAGSTAGEQVRAKRLDEYSMMKLTELGMTEEQVQGLQSLKELQKGLIIVSGPKQTGVTTTFYALLLNHDPFLNDINTLEKNPAAELQNITQHTYKLSDTGTSSYAQKFTSVVRMGPNIVGIADCEEEDCFVAAIKACQGGRLIHLATEASSVIKALGKVMKNAGDKTAVLDNLTAVVNQRLVRKLCPECKQAYQPNQALLKKFNLSADKIKLLYRPGDIEYDKHGKPIYCEHCQGTGFLGRIGIFETIIITDQIREEIKQAKTLHDISTIFRNKGMLYMQEQSISKVTEGITSINEVILEFATAKPQKKKTK